jgi:hypothetical protein
MIAAARVDTVVEQRLAVGVQRHPPEHAVQRSAEDIQRADPRAPVEPDQIIELQQ